ncbi:hypothetical protein ACOMHN_043936 [Nucella lapillus]
MLLTSYLLAWVVVVVVVNDYTRGSWTLGCCVPGKAEDSSTPPEGSPHPGPERQTVYGKVRGSVHTLSFLDDRRVERYLGIPYASPPLGDLRFEVSSVCLSVL